jgi:deazaflavin-dependent oxidoreductase (nitroreductase family)
MAGFNERLIVEFRANEGRVGGPFAGSPVLLLTSTGAKSGKKYTTPLVYTTDRDRYVIIASKGGSPTNPAWYHNLVANPRATIEVGTETVDVDVSVAQGSERDRLFDAQAALMPNFADYQRKTTRRIPVLVLERAEADGQA